MEEVGQTGAGPRGPGLHLRGSRGLLQCWPNHMCADFRDLSVACTSFKGFQEVKNHRAGPTLSF